MFYRAGEVHLRYLVWWNLFTVLTQAERIVPLLPPVHGPLCGCVICTVCSVSSVRTKMAWSNGRVILPQVTNFLLMAFWSLQDCGSVAAYFLWHEWCCWLFCCCHSTTEYYLQGCEWKGREPGGLVSWESWGSLMQPLHRGDRYLLCSYGALSHVLQSVHEPFLPIWK